MAKVTTDEAGVLQLTMLAQTLDESVENISAAAASLKDSFEEKRQLLGPHTDTINEILELVDAEAGSGASAVAAVSMRLNIVAQAIQEFIDQQMSVGGKGKSK